MADEKDDKKLRRKKSKSSLESALIASEIRYRRLFESAKDGILILDAETGMIIDVNPFLINLLGYSKEKFTQKALWEIGFFNDIVQNKEKFLELQQKEYVRYDDLPLVTSEGRKIHVEFVSNVYLEHNQNVIQCNIRDITERKLAEEEIKESEEKFRMIFENASEGISIYSDDPDSEKRRLIECNLQYAKMAGRSRDELLQFGNTIKLQKRNEEKANKDRMDSLKSGEEYYGSYSWIRPDGKENIIEYVGKPVMWKGKPYTIGIDRDVTEQKRLERELIESKNKAEESDRLKSAFLANMSHEIRTPMNGILGFTQLLKTPKLTGSEQQEFIGIIEKSGVRMLAIINDIINISRIESGHVEVTISETDINMLVEDIFNFFKPEADSKKLTLSFKNELPSYEAIIKTDKEKNFAVLSNLVKNSLKFTQTGSVEFGYERKDNFLEFFVSDTGLGIPTEQKEIIFERFRQGSEQLTRNYEGAGLGLAISKAYVEMLGGKIWLENNKKQGATFRFTIPYLNGIKENEAHETIAWEEIQKGKKLKILVVEDDKTSVMLLKILIKPLASDILQAITGKEAIETCRENTDIDLVLMDIQLPDINGYEATKIIRSFNNKLIIIAQTAFALSGDREKALEAGCNDYISKPINENVLFNVVERCFNKKIGSKTSTAG